MAGPDIQVISSLVVQRENGDVLLVRHSPDDERWWLPGDDLVPYEHPDDAAKRFLERDAPGLECGEPRMVFVESFRGRRGWHVIFHYTVEARGEVQEGTEGIHESGWFPAQDLPRTFHGSWERKVIERALGLPGARQ
jgi:ADP-ribose pyrophosphatase YjhB (NUDIX family)